MSDDSTTPSNEPAIPAAPEYVVQPPAVPGATGQYAPTPPYADGQPYPPAPQPYAPAYPAYAPGQPYMTPSRPASGLAVTSLVTGIAGLVLSFALFPLLSSLAAVITGHMALKQTRQNPAIGGRGMAITGLILGYIGIVILTIAIVVSVMSFILIGTAGLLPVLIS